MPSIEDVKNDPDLKFMIPDDTLVDIPKSRYENYDNLPLTTKSESIPENDKLNKEFELPPKIKELGNLYINTTDNRNKKHILAKVSDEYKKISISKNDIVSNMGTIKESIQNNVDTLLTDYEKQLVIDVLNTCFTIEDDYIVKDGEMHTDIIKLIEQKLIEIDERINNKTLAMRKKTLPMRNKTLPFRFGGVKPRKKLKKQTRKKLKKQTRKKLKMYKYYGGMDPEVKNTIADISGRIVIGGGIVTLGVYMILGAICVATSGLGCAIGGAFVVGVGIYAAVGGNKIRPFS